MQTLKLGNRVSWYFSSTRGFQHGLLRILNSWTPSQSCRIRTFRNGAQEYIFQNGFWLTQMQSDACSMTTICVYIIENTRVRLLRYRRHAPLAQPCRQESCVMMTIRMEKSMISVPQMASFIFDCVPCSKM